jgi:cystathionine gamma-lyase
MPPRTTDAAIPGPLYDHGPAVTERTRPQAGSADGDRPNLARTAEPMHDATRIIGGQRRKPATGEPFRPGPTFASTFALEGDPVGHRYTYGRFDNPTWTLFEEAVGELEGGRCVAFASGMAAVAGVFGSVLRSGDAVVVPSDSYYTTRLLAEGWFAGLGVEVRMAPTAGDGLGRAVGGAKLLWLETPSNPHLDVCDIRGLAETAHRAGALVAVDNTAATALHQKPLALGADFSVAADTKALAGHSDLLLGHVAVRDPDLFDGVHRWRTQMGAIPGPMEVWLAHRSLATLDVRLERMCANAQAIARFLRGRAEVHGVRYPGLEDDPSYALAGTQMTRPGHLVSFELRDRAAAERFLASSGLIVEATSFGGVHTTAERRARWSGDQVSEGFIRLSAGCEHPDDLLADIASALAAAHP